MFLVAFGTIHETHKHRCRVEAKGGHAKDRVLCNRLFVLALHHLKGPACGDLRKDHVRVDADTGEGISQLRLVAEIIAIVVANGEEGEVCRRKILAEPIAYNDASGESKDLWPLLRGLPDRGLPSATWT